MKSFSKILTTAIACFALACFSPAAQAQTYQNSQQSSQTSKLKYMICLEIKQGTFTLDIFEHIKNDINKVKIWIETSENFYNQVQTGTELNKSFKTGSFLVDGDISHLKIKVVEKKKIYR